MTTLETTTVKSLGGPDSGDSVSEGDNPEELKSRPSIMEYNANTGILWTSRGGKLDKRDAFYNTIETFFLESSVVAMETVNGELYAILRDEEGDVLVAINQADGVPTTVVAITGLNESQRISGLAYDGTSLYGATEDPHQLVTIDMGTGEVTSSVPLEVGGVSSLDFGPDVVLYAFTSGSYHTVNKTTGTRVDSGFIGKFGEYGNENYFTIASY